MLNKAKEKKAGANRGAQDVCLHYVCDIVSNMLRGVSAFVGYREGRHLRIVGTSYSLMKLLPPVLPFSCFEIQGGRGLAEDQESFTRATPTWLRQGKYRVVQFAFKRVGDGLLVVGGDDLPRILAARDANCLTKIGFLLEALTLLDEV